MPSALVEAGRTTTQRRALWGGVLAMALLAAVGGWLLAWTCDDAYIAFRYAANAHDGRGLVWNPAPFAPVEGYTCFSWVVLLWAAWSWFGVAPPEAANGLSIAFGVGLLLVTASAAARVRDRRGALRRRRRPRTPS
jgi:arabinofuranosyltransferase